MCVVQLVDFFFFKNLDHYVGTFLLVCVSLFVASLLSRCFPSMWRLALPCLFRTVGALLCLPPCAASAGPRCGLVWPCVAWWSLDANMPKECSCGFVCLMSSPLNYMTMNIWSIVLKKRVTSERELLRWDRVAFSQTWVCRLLGDPQIGALSFSLPFKTAQKGIRKKTTIKKEKKRKTDPHGV